MSNNPYTMAAEPGWIMIMPKFQVRLGSALPMPQRPSSRYLISCHLGCRPHCGSLLTS